MCALPRRERRLGGNVRGRAHFVVLYITVGLGQPHRHVRDRARRRRAAATSSRRSVAGRLGDRLGLAPVIVVASLIYGGGYIAGGLATEWHDWYCR